MTLTIRNLSDFETVTITSLADSLYGDPASQYDLTKYPGTTCAVPFDLAPLAQTQCFIVAKVLGAPGDVIHNTVTASGVDDNGEPVFDDASADVNITNVPGAIHVTKDPQPSSMNEPGGKVTFTVVVYNESYVDTIHLQSLTDQILGTADVCDLTMAGECGIKETTCAPLPTLAPQDSFTCTFTRDVTGSLAFVQHDTVRVTAITDDPQPQLLEDNASAAVTIADVFPDISLTKTADPNVVPETGGDVTFTIVVTNNSAVEMVGLHSLVDSVFGDLNDVGTCKTGDWIDPGASYTCSFTRFLSSDSLAPHTDTATAVGVDNEGNSDTAFDDATVTFTDVAPAIAVTKTASPATLPETGGEVTFTFRIENTGQEDVTITSIVDDTFGALAGDDDCKVGTPLLVGASCEC